MGKRGVVAVTKKGGHLVGKKIFLNHGFEVVDQVPPAFSLVARTFGEAPSPAFPQDWEERQARYGDGLTVVYADQCPYFHDAVRKALEAAEEVGVQARRAFERRRRLVVVAFSWMMVMVVQLRSLQADLMLLRIPQSEFRHGHF